MNSASTLWSKIPVVIRAVINGFIVQIAGFLILMIAVSANFKFLPEVPWAIVPLGVGLLAYWVYFGGQGWPKCTAGLRRHYRRSHPLRSHDRLMIIVAVILFAVTLECVAILQYAYWEMPPEALGMAAGLADLPLWSSIPLALATAFFVGVGEEMSFRGYMQVPIEDRHGPWLGLTVPALFFALAHGLDPHVLPIFFVASLGWGFIAWKANSIRPGIMAHTAIDAAAFLWAIFNLKGLQGLLKYSIQQDGFTPGYRALAIVAAVLVVATLTAFALLRRPRITLRASES